MRYRLYEIGSLPEGVTFHSNLQKIKKHVSRNYGTPTALLVRDGKRYLAVAPEPKKLALPLAIDAPILQGLVVNLRLQPDVYEVVLKNIQSEDIDIVTSFIGFAVRSALRNSDDLWRGNSPYIFYSKTPLELPKYHQKKPVNLYPGFSCNVTYLPSGEIGVVIDITHLYVDTRSLSERMRKVTDWRTLVGRHFVYEFGPNWYFIQLKSVEQKPIEKAQFMDPRSDTITNVYDYTMDKWKHNLTDALKRLNNDDRTIVYGYPNQSNQSYAAGSLAKLRYRTDDSEIGNLHRETILPPYQRLRRIQQVIDSHLTGNLKLNGKQINISSNPMRIESHTFPLPRQRFGNDAILEPPKLNSYAIKNYLKLREKWLSDEKIGVLSQDGGISSQFILVPLSLMEDEDIAERIQIDIETKVNLYSPVSYTPQVVVWDDSDTSNIPNLLESLKVQKQQMERAGIACALVILPQRISRSRTSKIRRHIKRMLHPEVRTKCILASEIIKRMPPPDCDDQKRIGLYDSYLKFTALDLLVVSGHRLWSIASLLNYDVYIGIDVLNNTAGFTFVADGGAICRFVPSTSEQLEALSAEQVSQILTKHLRELIPRIKEILGHLPRHIVIHRDGRWHDTEQLGFNHAIKQLFQEGLLTAEVITGVVEIQKTNAQRWRIFQRNGNRHFNPLVGAYHILGPELGLLCTTGYPSISKATAKPLVIRIADGNLEMMKVLKDIYWLSALVWTKPDGIQSTPLTIKLADNWLEATAANISDNEARFGEIVDFSNEDDQNIPRNQRNVL